ncbi:hypothetical protein HPB48_017714 [Haemaphysalis longicornis]|uniref:Protein Dr1 n=1 Tax=Haemaphysalis longicornis TaxID=44386 RepID=A0A9J6FWB5_HAELO|nr:hypothetical protein HPB48_017714 [Haemaphysalis longicornis]
MSSRRTKSSKEDDFSVIPRAAVVRMISEVQPDVRCSKETEDFFVACCTRFVQHMTTEALNICWFNKNRKIMSYHALAALERVGFGEFRKDIMAAVRNCKLTAARLRRKGSRLENLGVPLEVLQRQQQDLIDQARRHEEELAQHESAEMMEEEGTLEVRVKQEFP